MHFDFYLNFMSSLFAGALSLPWSSSTGNEGGDKLILTSQQNFLEKFHIIIGHVMDQEEKEPVEFDFQDPSPPPMKAVCQFSLTHGLGHNLAHGVVLGHIPMKVVLNHSSSFLSLSLPWS